MISHLNIHNELDQSAERESAMQINMKKIYNRSRFATFEIPTAISMELIQYYNHWSFTSFSYN